MDVLHENLHVKVAKAYYCESRRSSVVDDEDQSFVSERRH